MKKEDDAIFPFEKRCARILGELKSAAEVDVETARFGDILHLLDDRTRVFESIAESDHLALNQRIQGYFFRHAKIGASWRMKSTSSKLFGEFNLSHIMRSIVENYMSDTWSGETEFERELYSELRVFDDTPNTGSGRMTSLRASRGTTDPEIWFFDMRQGVMKMELDYSEYLDTALLTKGAMGWQYLFCDADLSGRGFTPVAEGLTEMVEVFPAIFPDYDYSDLRARLEERL